MSLGASIALGLVGWVVWGDAWELGRVLVGATLLLLMLIGVPLAARRGYRRMDATSSAPGINAAEIEPVLAAEATLIVTRRAAWQLSPRLLDVVVDGQRVAQIKNKGQVSVPVTVGPHSVRVLVDWCASRVVKIDARDGDVVRLLCGPSRGLRGWITGALRPEDYLQLTEMNGDSANGSSREPEL
ncbi:MAG TPA: hypothetical protein VNU19_00785 [Candidatus Acidoferrum sp.]|jgi:hypothetical protein|nr:hypothetical protein [Candidatus Acidoferrum sp.]